MSEVEVGFLRFFNFSNWTLSAEEGIAGVILATDTENHYRILLSAQFINHVKDREGKALGVLAEHVASYPDRTNIYKAREIYFGNLTYTGPVFW